MPWALPHFPPAWLYKTQLGGLGERAAPWSFLVLKHLAVRAGSVWAPSDPRLGKNGYEDAPAETGS